MWSGYLVLVAVVVEVVLHLQGSSFLEGLHLSTGCSMNNRVWSKNVSLKDYGFTFLWLEFMFADKGWKHGFVMNLKDQGD